MGSSMTLRRTQSWWIICAGIALLCPACQTIWYGQALRGQFEVISKTRPAAKVVRDPETSPELRKRLELVQELLQFAENELQLPSGGAYTAYADLEREAVLWAVFAAPEFDVEAIEWRYPVVGKLGYRGYFREADAEAFAAKLRDERGLDTAVVPVPAYSTLGWFHDPVLNTFIEYEEADLAGLIFHELTHKKYYRAGDTEFSEALAVAVEQEGVRRWLKSKGDEHQLANYNRQEAKLMRFVKRLLDVRAELQEIYNSGADEPTMKERKEEVLDALQSEIRGLIQKAGKTEDDTYWLRDDINNAHLNVVAAYFLRVPEFEAELAAANGDLELFFERLKQL